MSSEVGDVSVWPIVHDSDDVPKDVYTSYSSLTTFQGCPQRWNYSNVRKLRKQEKDRTYLDAGSWWHAVRQVNSLTRGMAHGSLKVVPEKVKLPNGEYVVVTDDLDERFWEALGMWWESLTGEVKEVWSSGYGDDFPTRLRDLDGTWRKHWADKLKHERPLATEMWWKRPHEFQLRGQVATLRLGGVLDELVWDDERQSLIVRDFKTTGAQLQPRTTLDDLMESQPQLYVWGVYPTIATWGLPSLERVQLEFDRTRIGKPSTPRVNADGTLSKSVTDFDYYTYVAWAKGPDGAGVPWGEVDKFYASGPRKGQPKFGTYTLDEELAEQLNTPEVWAKWFQRSSSPLNSRVVKSHLQSAVDTARAIIDMRERIEQTGEAARHFGFNCKRCDFVELCRAEMVGGRMDDFPLEMFGLTVKGQRKE